MAGLSAAIQNEVAFRLEIFLAAIMIPLAFFLGKTPLQKSLLISSILLVFVIELLNSAIEAVVDRIGTEHHDLSGRAKDLGSAAVFIALIMLVVIWGGVIWENW